LATTQLNQWVMRSIGGEGGIRTHDTLASMPHFECGAFNHSTTSPTRALNDAGRSDHTSAMAADAVEQRPLNQAERTGPAVSRPAPKPASHRRWRVEAQADRGMGDKLDFALQVNRYGLSRCRQPCPPEHGVCCGGGPTLTLRGVSIIVPREISAVLCFPHAERENSKEISYVCCH
jgi:hypothetical protein